MVKKALVMKAKKAPAAKRGSCLSGAEVRVVEQACKDAVKENPHLSCVGYKKLRQRQAHNDLQGHRRPEKRQERRRNMRGRATPPGVAQARRKQ